MDKRIPEEIDYILALDDFFASYYRDNLRLSIVCKNPLESELLCYALQAYGKMVNGHFPVDLDQHRSQIPFSESSLLANAPVENSDIINTRQAKLYRIHVLSFFHVDCTKYLNASICGEELYAKMVEASKRLNTSKQDAEEQNEELVK